MVSILIEPSYAHSVWCTSVLEGLVGQLKQKRISYGLASNLEEVCRDARYAFVVGTGDPWVNSALMGCNQMGVHPILLCSQATHRFSCNYSSVCSDVPSSTRHVIEQLRVLGSSRVALYGVNPQSIADQSRMECYLTLVEKEHQAVFFNCGSMKQCYASFMEAGDRFDAVLCANCFLAISLVRRLRRDAPERLRRLRIIGYQEVRLTELYADDIYTLRLNFHEYGKAAVMLMDCLQKNPHLTHATMAIDWDISELEREQHGQQNRSPAALPTLPDALDAFYQDPELNEMMLLESLLYESEEVDRKIIHGLGNDESYEQIAEKCFMSVSTVKYRLRKMLDLCHFRNRAELIELLRQYV